MCHEVFLGPWVQVEDHSCPERGKKLDHPDKNYMLSSFQAARVNRHKYNVVSAVETKCKFLKTSSKPITVKHRKKNEDKTIQ
jgi:hypothetical protein